MNRRGRQQRGSALVEFALTFVVLFGVFSGSFEFGYAFYAYNTLVNATREGARYASLKPYDSASSTPSAALQSAVQNMVAYGNPAGGATPILRGLAPSNVQLRQSKSITFTTCGCLWGG
jgi:Flp pilus assembly protein TadG